MIRATVLVTLLAAWVAIPAFAGPITISIDENGNGRPQSIGTDPGPGGLTGVLIYTLPFPGVQGDVLLTDSGVVLDLLRFNGNGTVIFYSDNINGIDSIGDTLAPPGSRYPNNVTIAEVGLEGNNGATYTPTANQPGYGTTDFTVTYNFVSDGTIVPEPSSFWLMAAGLGVLSSRWLIRRILLRTTTGQCTVDGGNALEARKDYPSLEFGFRFGDFLRTAQTVTAMRQVCTHRRSSAFRVTTKNCVIDRLVCLIDEAQVCDPDLARRGINGWPPGARYGRYSQVAHDVREITVLSRISNLQMELEVGIRGITAGFETLLE